MPKLGIITPNYKRPEILKLWCASIKRIRDDIGVEIPAVVVSEEVDKETCQSYDINHITQQNLFVSEKFNRGVEFMRDKVDYVMIMGSDDIASSQTIRRVLEKCKKEYDLIGVNSIYFYGVDGAHKGKLCLHSGERILGVGKTIHRRVLDEINWHPWGQEKNWGLDALVTMSIRPHVKTTSILSDTIIVDCKNVKVNINKASLWFGKRPAIDTNIFLNILGEEEREILMSL